MLRSIEHEKELAAMKSQFVTMASHEFRTPLTTILSSAFLLENYPEAELPKKKTQHINKIKQAVNNMTELLNDFILLGKLEEGQVKVNKSEIDMKQFCEEIEPELELLTKPKQKIAWEFSGIEIPAYLDKQLLRSIFLNLVGNAIKYSPAESTVEVRIKLNNHFFRLDVTDHGIGIPPQEQHHIFKRFFRAGNATNIEGTGLGLNIARKHIKLMNGEIEFFSKPDEGTTFTVTIPIEKELIPN